MNSKEIINEYTKLGELVAYEQSLGEQFIALTLAQRKAHKETQMQQEKVNQMKYNDIQN